jgi:hypothetical protein
MSIYPPVAEALFVNVGSEAAVDESGKNSVPVWRIGSRES